MINLTLYHSSTEIVEKPDTLHSRDYLDFGKGFYLTTIREQAEKYALRFKRRHKQSWLNVYDFSFDPSEWNILKFEIYNREWLDFVFKCRKGNVINEYDMIVGGIANDKVILTLDLFFSGQISEEVALERLRFEHPNIQYCIRSQEILDNCLKYIKSERL